uniref:Putative WD40 repeat-like protein n=2 Tax=Moniliophthora roreri TaxID=221103 RepID=A0A0W0GDD2_MONRR
MSGLNRSNKFSIDVEDAAETIRPLSMTPKWPDQKYSSCIHDTLSTADGRGTSRNLVICIDGTANQFGNRNTNVVELYSRLEKNDSLQVTYYNSGIGTYASPSWKSSTYYKQVLAHKIDLAFAWRFEKILLDAYKWLCERYEPGDRIFLFGFSRGAYQVRALSGMIEKVGLIHKGNEAQIPFAFELYRKCSTKQLSNPQPTRLNSEVEGRLSESILDATIAVPLAQPSALDQNADLSQTPKPSQQPAQDTSRAHEGRPLSRQGPLTETTESSQGKKVIPDEDAETFKRTFCRSNVKVHFVGVWDTVSSLGFARKEGLPLTTDGMTHVCTFRHALALDERRVKFLPEFARGGAGPRTNETEAPRSGTPHTKEVWFIGTHSDIGGGNVENKQLKNNGPSLRWMTREAAMTGLLLNPSSTRWSKSTKQMKESLTLLWRVVEILPIKRLTYKDPERTNQVTRWPHLCRRREIVTGQLVHSSVYVAADDNYKNRLKEKGWDELDTAKVEPDNFDEVTQKILSSVRLLSSVKYGDRKKHLEGLRNLFGSFEAQLALLNLSYDLYDQRKVSKESLAMMEVLVQTASDLFRKQHFSRMPPVIRMCLHHPDDRYIDAELFSIRRRGPITSFAFSPDSQRIACGTQSGNIFVRRADTGAEWKLQPGSGDTNLEWNEEEAHLSRVSCIMFSPDGKFIISGGWDKTIRLWNALTGKQIRDPVEIGGNPRYFALSDDGTLVSTSGPGAVRLEGFLSPTAQDGDHKWQGNPVPLAELDSRGNEVVSLALSPSRLVPQPRVTEPTASHSEPSLHTEPVAPHNEPNTPRTESTAPHTPPATNATAKTARQLWRGLIQSIQTPNSLQTPNPLQDTAQTAPSTTAADTNQQPYRIIAGSDNTILFHPQVRKEVASESVQKPEHRRAIQSVAFSQDGSMFFAGALDGAISMWNATSGELIAMWAASTGDDVTVFARWSGSKQVAVNSLAVVPNPDPNTRRNLIAAGLEDGMVRIWELPEVDLKNGKTGRTKAKMVMEQQYSTSPILSVAYSPDGERIAGCNADGLVIVWDAKGPTGDCILKQLKENKLWFP